MDATRWPEPVIEHLPFLENESDTKYLAIVDASADQLAEDELSGWLKLSSQFYLETEKNFGLVKTWLGCSPGILRAGGLTAARACVDSAVKMAETDSGIAAILLETTSDFLSSSKVSQLSQRAADAIRIIEMTEGGEAAAEGFLRTGATIQRYMSPRVYILWKETGFFFNNLNGELGAAYFTTEPEALERLYLSEITKILKITTIAAKDSPDAAIGFYKNAPRQLLKINPNIRDSVLETSYEHASGKRLASSGRFSSIVGKFSGEKRPVRGITGSFGEITGALVPYSNPVQETIFHLYQKIADLDGDASLAWLGSVKKLMETINPAFLPNWVEAGIKILKKDHQAGLNYFKMISGDADSQQKKWKEAAFLDDLKQMLTVYGQAMCGQPIRIRSMRDLIPENQPDSGMIETEEGIVFYLPEFRSEGRSLRENISLYRLDVSRMAGYIEFGTQNAEHPKIKALLSGLPDQELVHRLFQIVEDIRIYFSLEMNYRGLGREIDSLLARLAEAEMFSDRRPIGFAMAVLKMFCLRQFQPESVPETLQPIAIEIQKTLGDFPKRSDSVIDSCRKTIELYRLLAPLNISIETTGTETEVSAEMDPGTFKLDEPGGAADALPDSIADDPDNGGGETALSDEEIQRLLDSVQDITMISLLEDRLATGNLYLSDLDNHRVEPGQERALNDEYPMLPLRRLNRGPSRNTVRRAGRFFYDEWDFQAGEYRKKWCCLREKEIRSAPADIYQRIYSEHADLIRKVRFQFQRVRPESLDIVRAVPQGDEIDLNALVENRIDRKAGISPSDRIYLRKEKKLRRISTLFLVDMSASTGETVSEITDTNSENNSDADKRIVDIETESLIIISEAMDALGDAYAIGGFSGRGREEVDYYPIKTFDEPNSEEVKMRISGIEPKQSTRMGPAIRHAIGKMRRVDAEHKVMIILSDGFPQDLDYGEDRNSKDYALADTMMAMLEAKKEGIKPFCITVDQAGNDYLKAMCDPKNYLIIKNIHMLPDILPGIVETLMSA